MKKLAMALFLFCAAAYAQEESTSDVAWGNDKCSRKPNAQNEQQQSKQKKKKQKQQDEEAACACPSPHSMQIGGSYSYVWLTPKGSSAYTGNLGGAQFLYQYQPKDSLYQALKFAWRQGITKQGANSRFLLDFDAQQRIGLSYGTEDCSMSGTLFTGAGYRYLGQKVRLEGTASTHYNYNEIYIPVGILLNGAVCDSLRIGFNGIWMPQVYPAVTIVPVDAANWIIKRTLANFQVELPITYNYNESFTIELKPFFQYWQDGKTTSSSESNYGIFAARNTYLFTGTELNLGWIF